MTNFSALYAPLAANRSHGTVSPQLEPLLAAAYAAITRRPYSAERVAEAIEPLLRFLTTADGRTDANCHLVDYFFLGDGWESDWEDEPTELADILSDMCGALHDTVSAPNIAENFDSTPEQLLARLVAFRSRRATV